jgi:hypothetical protein
MTAALYLRQFNVLGKASFISSVACRNVRSFAIYIFDSAVRIVARTLPSISFAFFWAVGVTSTPLVVVVIR